MPAAPTTRPEPAPVAAAPAPVRNAGGSRTSASTPAADATPKENSANIALPDVRLPSVDIQVARPLPTAGASPAEMARRANGNADDFAGGSRVRGGNRP